ncbi:unnamed protein product [Paramecium pentaurelia]|uniref:Uncharacterized protein n=1 Tax=Paramecium pentaurelia TaxID=43138 RepID=A0A8S1WCH5_9CILI|nr:unnamed protein product [Paramecium pentaurelia]
MAFMTVFQKFEILESFRFQSNFHACASLGEQQFQKDPPFQCELLKKNLFYSIHLILYNVIYLYMKYTLKLYNYYN